MAGTSVAALAFSAQLAHAQVTSGSTHTNVATAGNASTVTTDNINAAGKTAFNRFGQFDVAQANNVTLILPNGTNNLVNVVANTNGVNINGVVTSRIASAAGDVGGNLYFISSGGFLVGATGSINTGRLIVRGKDSSGNLLNTDALFGQSAAFATSGLLDYAAVSSATINGRINAPGGIDIKASAFTVGAAGTLATGAAGVTGIQAIGGIVSTVGLVEGRALVRVDGGIAIVGDDSVTLTAGSTLNARQGTIGGFTVPGGIDIASSGTINLNGTLTAWDGTAGGVASDITVRTSKAVSPGGLSGRTIGSVFQDTSADTAINVGGTITGGNVSLSSAATSTSSDKFDTVTSTVGGLIGLGINYIASKLHVGLDVFVANTAATSAVTVNSGSVVTSKAKLTIAANSTASTKGSVEASTAGGDDAVSGVAIGAGVALTKSHATVTVNGALSAGGDVSIGASNDATSALEVTAVSTKNAVSAALAYTHADVDASVNVGGSVDAAGDVSIKAINAHTVIDDEEIGFSNKATAKSSQDGAGGGSAAVSDLDIASHVTVTGNVGATTAPHSVLVDSRTVTSENLNWAMATTGTGVTDKVKAVAKKQGLDLGSVIIGSLGKYSEKFTTIAGKLKPKEDADAPAPDPERDATKFGAAVSVLFNTQGSSADVTGHITTADKLTINSLVSDATVRNVAKAATAAKRDTDGNALTLAGAAAWSTADYTTTSTLGGVATAKTVDVNATTDRPIGIKTDFDLNPLDDTSSPSDLLSYAKDLKDKISPFLKPEQGLFGSSAGATASTDSADKAAISGSVSYAEITASTRAWINPLAQLTVGDHLGVNATSDIVLLNLGGALPKGFGTSGGKAAGIAVAISQIDPTTVAGIGKGVVVSRGTGSTFVNTDVQANNTVDAITLAPQAGTSKGITVSGTFGSTIIDGATRATVSKDARIDLGTGKFGLSALTELELWTVGGSVAVTKADGTGDSASAGSVGLAGALNYVDFDTGAKVGDASEDDDDSATTAAAASNAGVTSGSVGIDAKSTGSINTISVAGTVTDSAPAKPKQNSAGTETDAESPGLFDKVKDKLTYATGLISAPLSKSLSDYTAFADKYTKDAKDSAAVGQQDAMSKGTTVTKGFGVAGSASVNISKLGTIVDIASAKFTRAASADAATASFVAKAAEGVDMLAVSGGAAIAKGKKLEGGSTVISGAYALSYTSNTTDSTLAGSQVSGFGNVDVDAVANGLRISAALALSVDTTKSESGAAVAGAVSHLIARDGAKAAVTDSSVTGANVTAGGFNVLAYNGLVMAAGAGGLSWGASNAAGGAATVIDIASPSGRAVTDASLVRTAVSGFTDLGVRALTAGRIAGVAVAAGISTSQDDSKLALSAALSINLISMNSNALIDVGNTGTGTINIGGAVNVFAGDKTKNQVEAVAADGRTSGTAGTSMLGNYDLSSDAFSSDDPVQANDLAGGTQILSIAVPIAAGRGNSAGVGFAWNSIDNDRTASIIGGASAPTTNTITAKTLSVQAIDHSDIFTLGVGLGASKDGIGLMGSIGRNLITGSSSAGLGKSSGAANNIVVNITGAVGTTPNVSIGAAADGGIFGLAGAIAFGKNGAGGIAVGVNDIVHTDSAASGGIDQAPTDAGLHATLSGVSFKGTPDADVSTQTSGKILAIAFAGAVSTNGSAVSGAATANQLAPTIAASASKLNYLDITPGDLKVRAQDASKITSAALVLAVGAEGGGAAIGVGVNRINANVSASLTTATLDRVRVRNLLIDTNSTASTTSFGLGIGGGESFGGAGSVAVNLTNTNVDSLLTYTGGEITATGSVGVIAKRDTTIDVGAGAIAIGATGPAAGASIVVNDVGGSASAKIVGSATNTGTLQALAGAGNGFSGIRTGGLTEALPQFDSYNLFKNLTLDGLIKNETATYKGVVVNASSTHATRTAALTGAFTGEGGAIGITAVVGNVTDATTASIENTKIQAGSGGSAQSGVTVDVRASSQSVGMTFAGALAGSGDVAGAIPVISDGYSGMTTALIKGGEVSSTGSLAINAITNQSSTTLAIAAAGSAYVAAAVAGVSPRFQSTTTATLDQPKAVSVLGSGGIAVNATSKARALATFGTIAVSGGVAGAGAVVVATNENVTRATYNGVLDSTTGLGTVLVTAPKISIIAAGDFDATVAGASIAGSAAGALVGNGVGVVHRGEVSATGDGLRYSNTAGTIDVRATEAVSIVPVVGQVALGLSPTGAGASLGVIAILSQSKVDASLVRPTITANTVNVYATGYNQIDALNAGLAIGGLGIGANIIYIGVGKVSDTGSLYASQSGETSNNKTAAASGSDGNGGNKNLSQIATGGVQAKTVVTESGYATTQADRDKVTAGSAGTNSANGNASATSAFNTVSAPGDSSAARVRAQVTDVLRAGSTGSSLGQSTITATNLTIDSAANLRSKSTNAQLTGGQVAASATIGITRNAAESIAFLGNVTATGTNGVSTLKINAVTGEAGAVGAPGTATSPTKAADAEIYSGTVGALALAVGVADVRLQTKATAESTGTIDFQSATVSAKDDTNARGYVVGVAAGGGVLNIAVDNVVKDGIVAAKVSNTSYSDNLTVRADALGSVSSTTYAASGGTIFAGNAAVALATDRRTVQALIGEGSTIRSPVVLVQATSTPLVSANSFGIAVSGSVAAGASIAEASSSGNVSALVGEGTALGCDILQGCPVGSLTVRAQTKEASGRSNVEAVAKGSAGGLLAAINGSAAKATTDITTNAVVGANIDGTSSAATILPAQALTVEASRGISQFAESSGVTVAGVLAVGLQNATATSSGDTRAALDNVDGRMRSNTNATITSDVIDRNTAKVTAGAGGLGAGIAANATTNSNATATTELLTPNAYQFSSGILTATARTAADYKSVSDSTLATLAGGSGTTSANNVSSSATTNIGRSITNAGVGAGSKISASEIHIGASNVVGKNSTDGGSAAGAGGGVVTGQAASVNNDINQTSTVNLRDGLTLRQYGGDATLNTRASFIDAAISTSRAHSVSLDVGGAMSLPFGEVDANYNATNNVNIGKNILIRADQGIGIGTNVQQSIIDTAAVQIYGLAGLGGGAVNNTGTSNSQISVGDGTTIESMMDIQVAAGRASDGIRADNYRITSQTDTFNWTVLPLDSEATADTTVNATNKLVLGAATIRSARDLIIEGQTGTVGASASGTGHNPYLELFSQTNGSGDTHTNVAGSIKLDGTNLVAGFLNNRTISVSDNGGGATTLNGVAIGGDTGLAITTNDALYNSLADTDRLGQFQVSTGMFNTLDYLNSQITALSNQASSLGLTVPTDPATAAAGSPEQQALRDSLNTAASQSDILAKLATLYETRIALGQTARNVGSVVIGGSLSGTTLSSSGGVFAAGGRVTLTTDSITGGRASNLTANAGGVISITNTTGRDTILGNMFVPFKVNGAITYAGKATALPSSATTHLPTGNTDGAVTVTTGSTRSDIIVLGTVQNIAGAFQAKTPQGNYVQFGQVNVASFSADAPNGLFSVSTSGSFSQGLPLSYYYGSYGLSLYDVTNHNKTISAIDAVNYLASYVGTKRVGVDGQNVGYNGLVNGFASTFGRTTSDPLYDLFLRTTYTDTNYGGDFLHRSDPYGNAGAIRGNGTGSVDADKRWGGGYTAWLPCTVTCEFASEDGDLGNSVNQGLQSLFVWDGESGSVYRNDHIWQLPASYRNTVIVANPSGSQVPSTYPATATNYTPSITAQQVLISAQYVDISGTITAGPTKERSLGIGNDVTDYSQPIYGNIGGFQYFTGQYGTQSFGQAMATGSNTTIDLLHGSGQFGAAGQGNIGAQFVRTGISNGVAQGYIQVDDVTAAGGGSITISGKIVNTNPLGGGKLKVLNGYGNINIDNQTGYDIKVGTLNAGLSADGRITLRDTGVTTEYVNSVGGQVTRTINVGGNITTTNFSGNQGLSDGNAITYNPTGRVYYAWTDTRSIARDTDYYGPCSIWLCTVGPWTYTAGGQAPQGGSFITLQDNLYSNGGDAFTIAKALNGGNDKFVQVLSGYVTNNIHSSVSPGQDGRLGVVYDVPLAATLNIVSAAKATNPIAIVFDQGTSTGGINVRSNNGGKVTLTGALTFGGGTVQLGSTGGIVQEGEGAVVARNVSITANGSIGTASAAFRANLLGGLVTAVSNSGDINLAINSVASGSGQVTPTYLTGILAAGNVNISSNASLIGASTFGGTPYNIKAGGNVTLTSSGSITGFNYYGASNLQSVGLKIDLPNHGILNATAGGDVAIEQVSTTDLSANRVLRVGLITASGDVLLKAPGSIVAADATATVDQEKLARFIAAAKTLQLAPVCTGGCGAIDPATLGVVDQAVRADAYAAYDKLNSTVPGEASAAEAKLTKVFGSIPASRSSIATLAITRDAKVEYQVRAQARETYDRYALTNAAATAEESRGMAVATASGFIDQIAAFGGKAGITLGSNSATVTITNASAATLVPGGELYQIAIAQLAGRGVALAGPVATSVELKNGLQLYLDGLRAPLSDLLPDSLPTLTGLTGADRTAAISAAITNAALTGYVAKQNLATQRAQATSDALGKIQQIQLFAGNSGISVSANGATVTITNFNDPALKAGGSLYQLALSTLRSKVAADGSRETLALPTNGDIARGLQVYLDTLHMPIADLIPTALPTLTGGDLNAQRLTISNAISDAALAAWATKVQQTAVADLTSLFGSVPVTRAAVGTVALANMGARTEGAVWLQSMLDIAVPSTAFVPVADTQFETRAPVINARGVTLIAGNSIGAFDAQRTFTFDSSGFTGAAADKDLATAYLASAGPGDLTTTLLKDGTGKVLSASFTTRRDQPLQLNATGIVNAIAGTDSGTLGTKMTDGNTSVLGNIFLSNKGQLRLGTIVSQKWRTGGSTDGCASGAAPAGNCDSRIRIVAADVVGATSGAAQLNALVFDTAGSPRFNLLSNADGSAIVMGGLVRIEASNGSIKSANGGSVQVDAGALEVLRAAGDISLIRRQSRFIPIGTSAATPGGPSQFSFGNDLVIGDVFAGGRLQLDNPYGSFQVARLPSPLESENRNSRIVANVLAIRAAGDIGTADVGTTGIVGQFDIQAPIIDQFVAGFDYGTGLPGSGPAPAGLAPGNGFFALRGVTQIGGFQSSVLGARNDITISSIPGSPSSVTFLSNIYIGGLFNLTTDGDISFPDENIRITGLGIAQDPNTVDLSRLALNLKGKFTYVNRRNIILGSLTAGGGEIKSTAGYVQINGTIYGNGGPETPFTINGLKGVTAGSLGLGAVALVSDEGDVRLTGQSRASDLTLIGNNVFVAGGITGRNATLIADSTGNVSIGGAVFLQRSANRPDITSVFTLSGRDISVNDIVSAEDEINISGRSITGGASALFLNSRKLTLNATGALNLDPSALLSNIGEAYLTAGTAANGGVTLRLPDFSGGLIVVNAPVGITANGIQVSGNASLVTQGTLALNGSIYAGGAVNASGAQINFASGTGIRQASGITLNALNGIQAGSNVALQSSGALNIAARDSLALGTVQAREGSITLGSGSLVIGGMFTSDGYDFTINTGGGTSFASMVTLAGGLSVTAGGDIALGGALMLNGTTGNSTASFDAGGVFSMSNLARITGRTASAMTYINAGSVNMNTLSSIIGTGVSLFSRDTGTLGDIKASAALGQSVMLRSNGGLSIGTVTGGGTTIAASGGALTLRNALTGTTVSLSARDDLSTNGIAATSATIGSSLGAVTLKGTTRVTSGGKLIVTSPKAISLQGATSAAGGISLTGLSIATAGTGYITDLDQLGALTTLRADTINVQFTTSTAASPIALRIDAKGRTGGNIADATFKFTTPRAIIFDALWLNKGAITANSALTVTSLTMRDYLTLTTPGGSVALQGATAAPSATRTANTGSMTAARLVMTPGGGAPAVTVNGTSR